MKDFIEIPFGAEDSELCGFEYKIPDGYTAEIKDGKVIVKKEESEDERIRKWILEKVQGYADSGIPCSDEIQMANKALAYLEKQKKQKEQKPVEPSGKLSRRDYLYQLLIDQLITYSDYEYLIGQKSAEWSEEDEEMRLEAIRVLVSGCEKYRQESGHLPSWHKVIAWLKSLRPQPQGIYQQVVKELRNRCDRYEKNGMFTDERARDFLGNVRTKCKDAIECAPILDEPHWKPSEEQMNSLNLGIHALEEGGYYETASEIKELYEQLKNQMEG